LVIVLCISLVFSNIFKRTNSLNYAFCYFRSLIFKGIYNLVTKRFPKENKILYNKTNLILIKNITNIYDQ